MRAWLVPKLQRYDATRYYFLLAFLATHLGQRQSATLQSLRMVQSMHTQLAGFAIAAIMLAALLREAGFLLFGMVGTPPVEPTTGPPYADLLE